MSFSLSMCVTSIVVMKGWQMKNICEISVFLVVVVV